MLKKHLISIISILLLLSFSISAFAASFPDVTDDYSWAQDAISKMSETGVISGYPDGTFRPSNGITKIQAMLLISRLLGYNEDVYSPFMNDIADNAGLSSLSLTYENEVAFLIYKGIFTKEEIAAEASSMNEPLLRYHVAEYLTRAVGKYAQVKENYSKATGYADEAGIPDAYKPFVTYVKDASLMLGTDTTSFSPERQVTRAQMAVLLMRVITNLSLTTFEADIITYSSSEHNLKVDIAGAEGSYDTSEAKFYINGTVANAADFEEGETAILVFSDGVLSRIEKILPAEPEKPAIDESKVEARRTNAKIEQLNIAANYINVTDSADNQARKYYFKDDCKVTVEGITRTLSALRAKDHVILSLNVYDEIIAIEVTDLNSSFKGGKITNISTDGGLFITFEDNSGNLTTYTTMDSVSVVRNNEAATMADINEGDTVVECSLTYNKIAALKVRSIVKSASGSIDEIVISDDSSILVDGQRYKVDDEIKITVDGVEGDIYSLRLGMNAAITIDSNVITKITVTSVSDAGQFTGKITVINTSYGFVNLELVDGSEKQVFIKSTVKIYDDATGRDRALSSLEVGDNLLIVGKSVNGAFQATTVVLLAD